MASVSPASSSSSSGLLSGGLFVVPSPAEPVGDRWRRRLSEVGQDLWAADGKFKSSPLDSRQQHGRQRVDQQSVTVANGNSNNNGSYARFGHHPHHPSAYHHYHRSVAVPLAHHANSLHHPHQGGPAHHLAAGRFSVHHSPFAHHHRHQGQGGRVSVSTPPSSPRVVAPLETLNSAAHHHNQLQLNQHHHHPHLSHQPTPQQQQQPLMPANRPALPSKPSAGGSDEAVRK
ncbi:histidine-rich protein PFHRP-II-like [Daphnia pulex]|uniref:histidine-rich protein PFHRP-II-like n=1 Tax=Daphnia pulex TaxID=6669 RepID=UPI001EE0103A|nr:histidine-rich protein PFHRP-II-like [Daphnia pulex]